MLCKRHRRREPAPDLFAWSPSSDTQLGLQRTYRVQPHRYTAIPFKVVLSHCIIQLRRSEYSRKSAIPSNSNSSTGGRCNSRGFNLSRAYLFSRKTRPSLGQSIRLILPNFVLNPLCQFSPGVGLGLKDHLSKAIQDLGWGHSILTHLWLSI